MAKLQFKNDYSEGCHPSILKALADTNLVKQDGHGEDQYSAEAADRIRSAIGQPDAAVYFVSGGTQANMLLVAAALRPYQSVITANTSHLHVHETGAVEATGHKIEVANSTDGKLSPQIISGFLKQIGDVHMTQPKMVYISNSTELGTIYTKNELTKLSEYCRSNSLYLIMDGARLPVALVGKGNDLTLPDIAQLVDAFYIGGTKNGALLGEAIIITHPAIKEGFAFNSKQRGALLAKGRILGLQFRCLFEDGLLFELAKHANALAREMAVGIRSLGFDFLVEPCTNQLFPILPRAVIRRLEDDCAFYVWQEVDERHAAIRLVTSWATEKSACDTFIHLLKQVTHEQA